MLHDLIDGLIDVGAVLIVISFLLFLSEIL
jgi:hypothetical protein